MPIYEVILIARRGPDAVGSTRDVIEADTLDKAVARAVAAWREVEPELDFAALVVLAK
jgi:hypothetical protein